MSQPQPVTALTIGGSDSGGAAGIQADLKTFTALGVYGMSVLTVVTAQNSARVVRVQILPADLVAAQLDAVLSDYGAGAAKTGFIGDAVLVATIAPFFQNSDAPPLVVDPVLVNHRDEAIFAASVAAAYRERLLPLAPVVTPKRREAELLTGSEIGDRDAAERAARRLHALGARHVLLKYGRVGDQALDLSFDGEQMRWLQNPWLETANRHGSGDTLSAAIVAHLAAGLDVFAAIQRARAFTAAALAAAAGWRLGAGHGPVSHFVRPRRDT